MLRTISPRLFNRSATVLLSRFKSYGLPVLPESSDSFRLKAANNAPHDNHDSYAVKDPEGKVFTLIDLSHCKTTGARTNKEARYLAAKITFSHWLLQGILGPQAAPTVYPVYLERTNTRPQASWGVVQEPVKNKLGTLGELGEKLGLGSLAMEYQADSPLESKDGRVVLNLGKGKPTLPLKGRISLQVTLKMMVGFFNSKHPDHIAFINSNDAHEFPFAFPAVMDLTSAFAPSLMKEVIEAWENKIKRLELVKRLAEQPTDTYSSVLKVLDFTQSEEELREKYQAYNLLASLPAKFVEEGLAWFKLNAPKEAHEEIELIDKFIFCARAICLEVCNRLSMKMNPYSEGQKQSALPDAMQGYRPLKMPGT